jgi:hypothetical protein
VGVKTKNRLPVLFKSLTSPARPLDCSSNRGYYTDIVNPYSNKRRGVGAGRPRATEAERWEERCVT